MGKRANGEAWSVIRDAIKGEMQIADPMAFRGERHRLWLEVKDRYKGMASGGY